MDRQQESRTPLGTEARAPLGTEAEAPLSTEGRAQELDTPESRLYDEARRRVAELETLRSISLQLTSSLDLPTVLNSIAESTMALVGASDCLIYLYDETSECYRFGTALGRWAAADSVLPPRSGGLTATVVREGRPVVINDAPTHPLYVAGEAHKWGIQAIAGFPLQRAGQALGVLEVVYAEPHVFVEGELRLLDLLADQAAIAIANARLFESASVQLQELQVLHTVATICAEATSEDELIERVTRAIGEALYPDVFGVMLVDKGTSVLRAHPSYQEEERAKGMSISLGQGITGTVAASGRPWRVGDVSREPAYIEAWAGTCSELCVPLKMGERVIGVINAESRLQHAFSEDDERLLATVAGQLATAIEKVRLYQAAQLEIAERARAEEELRQHRDHLGELVAGQTAALRETNLRLQQEVSERIEVQRERERLLATERRRADELDALRTTMAEITAELELSNLLQAIVERATVLLDATGGELGFYEPACGEVRIVVSHNLGEDYVGVRHARGEGAMGQVAASGEALIVEDYRAWEGRAPQYAGLPLCATMLVPLEVAGRLVGVISIAAFDPSRKFGPADLHLLGLFAQQAATAIENARLYDQAQREIAERARAEAELRTTQEHLEELVQARTTELRESRERYRTLFDGVPVGLYRTTPAGQFVEANLALVEMMGFSRREELLAANVVDLYLNPRDRARLRKWVEQKGVLRDFEARLVRHDGAVIWGSLTLRVVQDERGQALYYEGSLEDISERKRAEAEIGRYQMHLEELVEERTAELRESKERYRTLFDGVPVGLYRTTPEGRVLNANRAAAQMFGFPRREDMLAASAPDYFVNVQERSRWQTLMEQAGVVRDFEERLLRYDGTVIWVSDTARAVKDERGQVLYYEGSIEDISERKKIEGELRRQKEYYEALFVNNPVAVVTADLDGRVVSWNPTAEKLFGYASEEAIGRELDDLVASDPRVRQEAQRYTKEVLVTGRVQATTRRTHRDGSLVDVEVLALPVTVGDQRVGFIVIYIDITDLQQARRAAELASQAKSRFLANISHELRTPLNAILGFAQLMDGKPNLTPDQQENLSIINRSGEHLLALINDVLDMSKIEAGQATLEETRFDLYGLLDSLQELFLMRAQDKGLALSLERAESVPRYVQADEGKLRQVLSNLLGNACKFTREGEIILRASSSAQAPNVLHFEVEDTGPGISAEELAAVFDAFVQTETGRSSQEGTGLGLPISQQYVRLMGGELVVRSETGRGSVFSFAVPVQPVDAASVQVGGPGRHVLGLEPGQRAPDGGPYRLLVADDRDTDRRLLMRVLADLARAGGSLEVRVLADLEQPGRILEVREAANGQEAIEVWEHWRPHLIWMDMRMPVLDGHQATRRIKAQPQGQGTIIVALTATAFEEDRQRILLNGCDDFVRKPFRRSEIHEALARHLKLRFVYEEEQPQPTAPRPSVAVAFSEEWLRAPSLPKGWVSEMRQAVIQADLDHILALIDRIQARNPDLAVVLTELAGNFDYNGIRALLERMGGER